MSLLRRRWRINGVATTEESVADLARFERRVLLASRGYAAVHFLECILDVIKRCRSSLEIRILVDRLGCSRVTIMYDGKHSCRKRCALRRCLGIGSVGIALNMSITESTLNHWDIHAALNKFLAQPDLVTVSCQ